MPQWRQVGTTDGKHLAYRLLRAIQVSTTVSGLSDIDSMPWSSSHSARSGWSEGPWPQMPTYLPCVLAGLDGAARACAARRGRARRTPAATRRGVAVEAEGQLGHVVGADREAVEVLEELRRR